MHRANQYKRLYDTARWRKHRRHHLSQHPLCEKCRDKGHTVAAEVAHHLTPHKGNLVLFYTGKLQSLCRACHDDITQNEERSGHSNEIGEDGWPTDNNHPVYHTADRYT